MRTLLLWLMPLAMQAASYNLAELELLALKNHPAAALADAGNRAAEGMRKQAGYYPNPTIGLGADEVAGGPIIRGGEWGVFVEQRIVTGGKLGIEKRIAGAGVDAAKASGNTELLQLRRAVRSLFYQALAEQKLVEVRTRLLASAKESAATAAQLMNVGILDQPDVLSARIEAQRAALAASASQTASVRTWRQLAAITGLPPMPLPTLAGNLEPLPAFDAEAISKRVQQESPQIAAALAGIGRADGLLAREKASRIPDLKVRSGLRYNRELLEVNNRPVGKETFLDIGVEVPLFNRNQGNIAAAAAERDRARLGFERLKIEVESRLAGLIKEHQDARFSVQLLRDDILPKAREAQEMYQANYKAMSGTYPQVLMNQRNLFQLEEDTVRSLADAWRTWVDLDSLLLDH